MYRIYLVEDDYTLAQAIKKQIEAYGHEVVCVTDFERVSEEALRLKPHLILMDIKLPYRDGYYWCSQIRQQSSVPIVFLSSASDDMNVVMAINMGGDDFIPKPVEPMVLTAKVGAVLRRTYEMKEQLSVMEFNGAFLDLSDGSVNYEGKVIDLTKNEFRILQTLLENKGRIVSRDTLMNRLWQSDIYIEENTLTVNVARLRHKLEDNGLKDVITTKTGAGYIVG